MTAPDAMTVDKRIDRLHGFGLLWSALILASVATTFFVDSGWPLVAGCVFFVAMFQTNNRIIALNCERYEKERSRAR